MIQRDITFIIMNKYMVLKCVSATIIYHASNFYIILSCITFFISYGNKKYIMRLFILIFTKSWRGKKGVAAIRDCARRAWKQLQNRSLADLIWRSWCIIHREIDAWYMNIPIHDMRSTKIVLLRIWWLLAQTFRCSKA